MKKKEVFGVVHVVRSPSPPCIRLKVAVLKRRVVVLLLDAVVRFVPSRKTKGLTLKMAQYRECSPIIREDSLYLVGYLLFTDLSISSVPARGLGCPQKKYTG